MLIYMLTVKEKPSIRDNADGLQKEYKAPLGPPKISSQSSQYNYLSSASPSDISR